MNEMQQSVCNFLHFFDLTISENFDLCFSQKNNLSLSSNFKFIFELSGKTDQKLLYEEIMEMSIRSFICQLLIVLQ